MCLHYRCLYEVVDVGIVWFKVSLGPAELSVVIKALSMLKRSSSSIEVLLHMFLTPTSILDWTSSWLSPDAKQRLWFKTRSSKKFHLFSAESTPSGGLFISWWRAYSWSNCSSRIFDTWSCDIWLPKSFPSFCCPSNISA